MRSYVHGVAAPVRKAIILVFFYSIILLFTNNCPTDDVRPFHLCYRKYRWCRDHLFCYGCHDPKFPNMLLLHIETCHAQFNNFLDYWRMSECPKVACVHSATAIRNQIFTRIAIIGLVRCRPKIVIIVLCDIITFCKHHFFLLLDKQPFQLSAVPF